jgi:transcriptional regulator with XRE-family HTH domain
MKDFGGYLGSLRNGANLPLDQLAKIVGSSKSTLSRLENNDVMRPFRHAMRKLVISLAEILCTTSRETERYLELAGIDKNLLTHQERIQLGYFTQVPIGAEQEQQELERLKETYNELLSNLEEKETKIGINKAPKNLKLKIQGYANTLQEIQNRLSIINGTQLDEVLEATHVYHTSLPNGKIVVGHQYGEELCMDLTSYNLHSLASSGAKHLMEMADADCFAVDDCIILANSRDFQGWGPQQIETTIVSTPLPIPNDLDEIRIQKIPEIESYYRNGTHYRLLSFTPSFGEPEHIRVTIAPLNFFDYYSLTPFFDEPLLSTLDGSKISIRQKYGNTALTYVSTDRGTALIPTPISIQCIVVTKDENIILMRRSSMVAFYPNHWSASFEETMNAPSSDNHNTGERSYETDFFKGALRGLDEEFAITADNVESAKVLSLNVEYLTLSVDVITLIRLKLTADEIRQNWLLKAWDKNEASKLELLPNDLQAILNKFFSKTLWHPTSRMRLMQLMFHTYGIDAVAKAVKAKGETKS